MNLNTVGYWIIESLEGIKKNSKTFFTGLGIMLVVLIFIGGFYIMYLNANSFMGSLSASESKVYLFVDGLTDDDVTMILGDLYSIDGISNVEYLTTEQAYKRATEEMGISAKGYSAEDEVFPPSFVLTIEEKGNGDITPIKNAVYAIPKLHDAITSETGFETSETVIKLAISARVVSGTVLIILIVLGCLVMMNSIKLALYARRKEISIMKYVGATDSFTRAPFIIEGLIIAFIAAGIAIILIRVCYGGIISFTENFPFLYGFIVPLDKALLESSVILLIVSVIIGTVGSSLSISKYLDV